MRAGEFAILGEAKAITLRKVQVTNGWGMVIGGSADVRLTQVSISDVTENDGFGIKVFGSGPSISAENEDHVEVIDCAGGIFVDVDDGGRVSLQGVNVMGTRVSAALKVAGQGDVTLTLKNFQLRSNFGGGMGISRINGTVRIIGDKETSSVSIAAL